MWAFEYHANLCFKTIDIQHKHGEFLIVTAVIYSTPANYSCMKNQDVMDY